MASTQTSLWQVLGDLMQQVPLSKDKVEAVLSTTLTERAEPSNELFHFYTGPRIELSEGVVISDLDLRIKRTGPHPGFLVLSIGGSCVTLDQVRKRFGALQITEVPRGRSPEEATMHTTSQRWGALSFGFKERNPDCLALVAFDPSAR